MISLFLDTADKDIIIGILKDFKLIYFRKELNNNDLSINMLPMIDEAFKNVKINIKKVDKIFVTNGPGSFTGIRIGLTFAKTLAWSLNKDIILLSKLEVLASSVKDKFAIPYIDARRGYVYAGVYYNLKNVYEDKYILFEELKNNTLDLDSKFIDFNNAEYDIVSVIKKHYEDKPINPHLANPNYLKKTQAEENLNDKRN